MHFPQFFITGDTVQSGRYAPCSYHLLLFCPFFRSFVLVPKLPRPLGCFAPFRKMGRPGRYVHPQARYPRSPAYWTKLVVGLMLLQLGNAAMQTLHGVHSSVWCKATASRSAQGRCRSKSANPESTRPMAAQNCS